MTESQSAESFAQNAITSSFLISTPYCYIPQKCLHLAVQTRSRQFFCLFLKPYLENRTEKTHDCTKAEQTSYNDET